MGVKSIQRSAQAAITHFEKEQALYKKIETELIKITGIKCLRVGRLAGDGIGVCLEKDGNCDSAQLSDVLAYIHEYGTITEQEILDIAIL